MTFNWLFFGGGRVTRLLPPSSPSARLSFLSLWKDTSQKSQWSAITGRALLRISQEMFRPFFSNRHSVCFCFTLISLVFKVLIPRRRRKRIFQNFPHETRQVLGKIVFLDHSPPSGTFEPSIFYTQFLLLISVAWCSTTRGQWCMEVISFSSTDGDKICWWECWFVMKGHWLWQ